MKVILLQDVAKLGRKGAIVEVPNGQAQNQLIPRKMAKPATTENLKKAQSEAFGREEIEAKITTKYHALKLALKDKPIVIKAPKNKNGHLFAAITKDQVLAAMNEMGILADPDMVNVPRTIKEEGDHEGHLIHKTEKSPFTIKIE